MGEGNIASLQPGTVIANRYEVIKCLGAGSMGLVYSCKHKDLAGHLVAVKVLFNEVAQDKIAAQRFQNEIVASYGVSHPNVVRAYEYVRDGEILAYSMEYVGGGDLADRLSNPEVKMPIIEILRLLAQMCSGVQAIHDAGIIHRDLKPENILITKEGNVKITDFGIARTGSGPKLTEHGGVVGTLDYVSPEYMLNSQVDWRSDIYALGVLAYEMVTNRAPFSGESVYATMTRRLKQDPDPPSKYRSDCPPTLDAIVLKMLNRDPEKRYQAASDILHDISELSPQPVAVPQNVGHTSVIRRSDIPVVESGKSVYAGEGSSITSTDIWQPDSGSFSKEQVLNAFGATDKKIPPTVTGNSNIAAPSKEQSYTDYDEDTLHNPVTMDTLRDLEDTYAISGKSGQGWDTPPSAVLNESVHGGSINKDKLDRLMHAREESLARKWNTLDWLIILVSLSLGITTGIYGIRQIFPGIF